MRDILDSHPAVTGVVLDLPVVAAATKRRLAADGLGADVGWSRAISSGRFRLAATSISSPSSCKTGTTPSDEDLERCRERCRIRRGFW